MLTNANAQHPKFFLSDFKKILTDPLQLYEIKMDFYTNDMFFLSVFYGTILLFARGCGKAPLTSSDYRIDLNEKASWFALENCALSLPPIDSWRTANEAFPQSLFRAKRRRQRRRWL